MYKVKSFQIAQHISIKQVRDYYKEALLFSEADAVFYKLKEHQYIYVFQFGIVSFFNIENDDIENIKRELKQFGKGNVTSTLSEDITVNVIPETSEVAFDSVTIPTFDEEMIRLIMLYTSQSVALDRYYEITDSLLEDAHVHSRNLEDTGKLKISSKHLKQFIGRTLNLKNRISENLYIFDSPDVTWENEQLAKLDNQLKLTFDLKNRYKIIQDKITIVKENLELFKGIWDHRESATLEWIIIILILVEVVDMFILKFF